MRKTDQTAMMRKTDQTAMMRSTDQTAMMRSTDQTAIMELRTIRTLDNSELGQFGPDSDLSC